MPDSGQLTNAMQKLTLKEKNQVNEPVLNDDEVMDEVMFPNARIVLIDPYTAGMIDDDEDGLIGRPEDFLWLVVKVMMFLGVAACALLVYALIHGAKAAEPTPEMVAASKVLTIADCLGILSGLNSLDSGYQVIVAQGKPTEAAVTMHFKLPGRLRDTIGHDEFLLGQIQQEVSAANRRTQLEIMGEHQDPIKPGSKENMIFDERMTEYTSRPCTAQLEHIRDVDLDLDHNDVPGSVLSLLTKIRDK